MYMVILDELKAGFNVSTQAGQSDSVNKTSVESAAQGEDFGEVRDA
jgi:hypothetical protein